MIRLVATELLKLRTTRTFWALSGVILGLVALLVILPLAIDAPLTSEDDVRSLLSTAGASGLLALILGVVFGAGEYRHGTIAWTLLITPNRLRVSAAQALGCAAAGLAIGVVAAALTAAIALPWLAATDSATLPAGEMLGLFAGGILYTALSGAFGAGIGALLRNQVAAVVLVLVLLFVIDPTISALSDGYARFSLGGLGTALSGGPEEDALGDDLLPFGLAALVWAAYTAALVVSAAVVTSRRDL